MKLKLRVSTKDFRSALKLYEKATKKDMVDVINRAGKNVAFRSISLTPMASMAKLNQVKPGRRGPKGRLLYALAARKGARRGQGMEAAAQKIFRERIRSRKYIGIGWVEAAKDFGGRPRLKTKPGGRASKGYGRKASRLRLEAWLYNFSVGAEKVGKVPLNRAMAFVAKDMTAYAQKKMRQTAGKYSGRRQ